MRSPRTSMIFALPCSVSVRMPAWLPVKLTAGWPRSSTAIDSSAIEMRSPAVSSMSISRPPGRSRDVVGEADEIVGRLAHRRDDDDDVVARPARPHDVIGHGTDAIRVGDRRPAELLHEERHGRQGYRRTRT